MPELCLQERYASQSRCFGCGPANPEGLRIRSFESPDNPATLVARFLPGPNHQAFEGVVNGGILGSVLDCHCNWTAAMHFMRTRGQDKPATTVTARYQITLLTPTPTNTPLELAAAVVEAFDHKVVVEGTLQADGAACATCRGTFALVRSGHPAYGRW